MKLLYKKEKGKWILSACFFVIFFGVIYFTFPICFATNDDTGIMFTLAGYKTGTPFANQQFVNSVFGHIFAFLYTKTPDVSWYTLFHVFCLYLGCVSFGKTLLKISYRKEIPIYLSAIILLIFSCSIFIMPIQTMQFTVTPIILGVGAISLILGMDDTGGRVLRTFETCIIMLSIIIAFLWRQSSANILMIYLCVVAVYRLVNLFFSERKIFKEACLFFLGISLICVSIVTISMRFDYQQKNNETWKEFNYYRSMFIDYPTITYAEDPELYQAIGWDEEYFNLAKKWFFLDDRFSTENLKVIVEKSNAKKTDETKKISEIAEKFMGLFKKDKIALWLFIFFLLIFMSVCILIAKNKEKRKMQKNIDLSMILLVVLLVVLFCAYLCFKGRFILRAFQVVIIPAISILYYIFFSYLEQLKKAYGFIVFGFSGILVASGTVHTLYGEERVGYYSEELKIVQSYMEYVVENYEDVFIYDIELGNYFNAYITFPDLKPSNLLFYGGSTIYSELWYEQLEKNGLEENVRSEIFFRENVYFMAKNPDKIWRYLNSIYENVDCIIIDEIEGEIKIYNFLI